MFIRIVIVLLIVAIAAMHCNPATHHYDTLLWSAEFPERYDDLSSVPSPKHRIELIRSLQGECMYVVGSLHEEGATFKYPDLEWWKPYILAHLHKKDGAVILREARKPLNSSTSSGLDYVYRTGQGDYVHYWATFRHGKMYFVMVKAPTEAELNSWTACRFRESVQLFAPLTVPR